MIKAEPIGFIATAQIEPKRGDDSRTGLCNSILLWCLGSRRYRSLWGSGIPWTRNSCRCDEALEACACGWAKRRGVRRSGNHGKLLFLVWRCIFYETAKASFGLLSCLLFAKQHRDMPLLDCLAQKTFSS